MKTSEIRVLIQDSSNTEWFSNKIETFNFPYINFTQSFEGVVAIYEFVIQQSKGRENINDIGGSKTYFQTLQKNIANFVSSYSTQPAHYLDQHWQQHVSSIINDTRSKPFLYNIPQTEFLVKLSIEYPEYFSGAFNAITGQDINANNRDSLYGSILTYEFLLKENTEISGRKKAEQKSISKLRNDFQTYISTSEKDLGEYLQNIKSQNTEYGTFIDDLKTAKEELFTERFETTKNEERNKRYLERKTEILKLEHTYEEKLKLSKPAEYRSTKASDLKKEGWIAFGGVFILIILSSVSLLFILWKAPDQIYSSRFNGDKSAAIRRTIIYATFISFLAFGIKAVMKVMFSSFHLARDAEERHTLTFFYLALAKDSTIEKEDRQLIMQSLFSRADTGLLKEDSSPTMPNDITGKIFGK